MFNENSLSHCSIMDRMSLNGAGRMQAANIDRWLEVNYNAPAGIQNNLCFLRFFAARVFLNTLKTISKGSPIARGNESLFQKTISFSGPVVLQNGRSLLGCTENAGGSPECAKCNDEMFHG